MPLEQGHSKPAPTDLAHTLRRQYQGALFRTAASLGLWFFALLAYLVSGFGPRPFVGISLVVVLVQLFNGTFLTLLTKSRSPRFFDLAGLCSNLAETILYTAIIHFTGGVEAGFLAPIYCVLVAYLGMVAPWRYPVIMVLWSMVCFDSLVFLEYLDVLPHQSPLLGAPPGYTYPAINQLMTVLTVDAILGLMAFVSINIAGRLRSARARLRKQNMELEARVAGRTVELTAVNHSLRTSLEEQRRAEAALRESEEKYRGILENLEDGYWEADTGGRLTLVNDAMARLLGSDPAAPLGQRLKDWLDADTAAGVDATLDQIRRTREPARSLEWTLIPKDSRRRQVETSAGPILGPFGQVAGFRGIARDVTFRNQTQMELRQTRDFLQSIVHSSTDAIATVDLDGRIVYASPKCAELTGYPPEEFLGRRVMDFYGRGKEDAIGLRDALAQTGEIRDYELQLRCKNGQLLDISMSASYLRSGNGRIEGFLGMYRDITQSKKLEAQLQFAQKIEALGTLAGGLAHDFNNLLMAIQGQVSLLLLRSDPGQPEYPLLKSIENQVQSGARLTAQLLGYARKGQYEVHPHDLGRLIRRTAETFGRARKDITLEMNFAAVSTVVEGDEGQLEQVLMNLFVNAGDAMPGGGRLTIRTALVHHEAIRTPIFQPEQGFYVQADVIDTGAGMTPDVMERIFDPFFTTKEMGRGTGLGLASAYGIIKSHKGYIQAESAPGLGSTFRFYLPASNRPVYTAVQTTGPLLTGAETILMVDDEDVILDVSADLLEELGYRVLTARDGRAALEKYQAHQNEIDLVILDMIMPHLGGGEVFDRLKEQNPGLRVILSSGYSLNGQAREILDRGCDGFIQKPFNLEQLSRKVRDVLDAPKAC